MISYIALSALLNIVKVFEIFYKTNGFNAAIVMTSVGLSAFIFVKDFKRAPSIKEKLVFSFSCLFGIIIIDLIMLLFVKTRFLVALEQIDITMIELIILVYSIEFLGIFSFFALMTKILAKTKK